MAFSFKRLYRAYLACRKRKRATSQAQHYELHLLNELVSAHERLQNQSWQPRRTACFVTTRPKAREIHAAAFADRVIHHLLVPQLEKRYEPLFIHDSYSNRKDKGTHKAVLRLQQFMRQVSCNQKRRAYYLQLDIKNFFNSINKPLLFKLLKKKITDPQLIWLCRSLLIHNPCLNVKEYGSRKKFAQVPPHKRLKNAPPHTGLPIGNLTSQFFANVYLNELDQFIKHQLKCKHYLRYVDDFILLHHDKAQLESWREAIIEFLQTCLLLVLKDNGKLQPVSNGADFLGYIVRPHYCLVRRRVVGNLREKLNQFNSNGELSRPYSPYNTAITIETIELLYATLASYLGHFSHASSYRLIRSLWQEYPWLNRYFRLTFPKEPQTNKVYAKLIYSPYLRMLRKKSKQGIRLYIPA